MFSGENSIEKKNSLYSHFSSKPTDIEMENEETEIQFLFLVIKSSLFILQI